MSTTTAQELLSYDEFVRRHGDEKWVDLIDGRVVRYPMPHGEHGFVVTNVVLTLGGYIKSNGLGRGFTCDTFIRTRIDPPRCRGADFCFASYAKLPREAEVPRTPLEFAPELVVEVRSPSDRVSDMMEKATEYLQAGVTVVVIVDPLVDSVAVFREAELPFRLSNGDELTLPDVLPGFAVPVKAFFE